MDKEKLIADLQNALDNQNASQLESLATQATEAFPEDAFGYAYMAEHFLLQEPPSYAKAEQNLATASSKDDSNAAYLVRFGDVKAEQDLAEDARLLYLKALRLDADNVGALVGYGLYQSRIAGRMDAALEQYNKAESINPDFPNLSLFIAEAQFNNREFEQSKDRLEQILAKGFDLDTTLLYINTLDELKLYDIIREQFKILIKQMPEVPEFHLDYAKYLFISKDYNAVVESVERGIELSSPDVLGSFIVYEPYFGALQKLGEFKKLKEAINQTIAKYPDNIDLLILRAETSTSSGDYDSAQSDYEKLIDLSPTQNEKIIYKFELAQILLKKKDNSAAKDLFDEIKKIDPGLGALGKASVLYNNGDLDGSFQILLEQRRKGNRSAYDYIKQNFVDFLKNKKQEILSEHASDIENNKNNQNLSAVFGNLYQIIDLETYDGSVLTNDIKKLLMNQLRSYTLLMTENGIFIMNPNDLQNFTYSVKTEKSNEFELECYPFDGDNTFTMELITTSKGLNISQDSKLIFVLDKIPNDKISADIRNMVLDNFEKEDLAFLGSKAQGFLDVIYK